VVKWKKMAGVQQDQRIEIRDEKEKLEARSLLDVEERQKTRKQNVFQPTATHQRDTRGSGRGVGGDGVIREARSSSFMKHKQGHLCFEGCN